MVSNERAARRVDLTYRLAGPVGLSATTQGRTWFFDLPADRDRTPQWTELLNRLFYDANVALRRSEPADASWLMLDEVTMSDVDLAAMLAWTGDTSADQVQTCLPWVLSSQRVVWEFAPAISSTTPARTTAWPQPISPS